MLVVTVLVAGSVVQHEFSIGNRLGYNMVVGAKGGRLDLLINSVYYLSRPIENIPWSYYKEFLPASEHKDGKPGKYAGYVLEDDPDPESRGLAIPICLGDFVGDYKAALSCRRHYARDVHQAAALEIRKRRGLQNQRLRHRRRRSGSAPSIWV